MNFVSKRMNLLLKMMDFVLKRMNFALTMMNFVFKMSRVVDALDYIKGTMRLKVIRSIQKSTIRAIQQYFWRI